MVFLDMSQSLYLNSRKIIYFVPNFGQNKKLRGLTVPNFHQFQTDYTKDQCPNQMFVESIQRLNSFPFLPIQYLAGILNDVPAYKKIIDLSVKSFALKLYKLNIYSQVLIAVRLISYLSSEFHFDLKDLFHGVWMIVLLVAFVMLMN